MNYIDVIKKEVKTSKNGNLVKRTKGEKIRIYWSIKVHQIDNFKVFWFEFSSILRNVTIYRVLFKLNKNQIMRFYVLKSQYFRMGLDNDSFALIT